MLSILQQCVIAGKIKLHARESVSIAQGSGLASHPQGRRHRGAAAPRDPCGLHCRQHHLIPVLFVRLLGNEEPMNWFLKLWSRVLAATVLVDRDGAPKTPDP